MKLIEDAGQVWHKLWSVRLAIAAALVSAAQAAWDAHESGQTRIGTLIAFGLAAAGGVARIVVQETVRRG